MTPERWQRVKELLGPALELDPAKRADYLDQACEGDPTLRPDLERLLVAEQKAGPDFLSDPVILEELALEPPHADAWVGRRLGPYQIAEEIGTGGMGEVYRAVRADDEYRKEVAIKLVRSGQDSSFVLSRFKNERQILASLDHPNIARLLDGGTTKEGVPYFVMELIEGERINNYCDGRKLSTTERLRLFLQVCSAVQYAHQHLVIHRDIKPGNVLVTAEGVPKLLDFGIAKILESGEIANQQEQTISLLRLLTPEYASPEQVKGEPITTVSDVYSLGVVLYELLTGRTPYSVPTRTPHEISRAVCESEPEKPSAAARRKQSPGDGETERTDSLALSATREGSPEKLSKRLSGDLDNIVLMALRKEPQRRYTSVEQFAQDIRRHLEGLPVSARTNTLSYRCRKYVLRHKLGVATATLVVLSLLTGVALTLREARIARANELRAEHRLQQTRELTESLVGDLSNATGNGATPAIVLMRQKAVDYLQQVLKEENTNHGIRVALAQSYERLGEALGNAGMGNMGDIQRALENYERAIPLFEQELAAEPGNTRLRLDLRNAYTEKALALGWTDISACLQTHNKALPLLAGENPELDAIVNDLGWEYELIGQAYGVPYFPNRGDTSRALEYLQKSISLAEKWYGRSGEFEDWGHLYYAAVVDMAAVLWARGHTAEALKYQLQAEAILTSHFSRSQPAGNNLLTYWSSQSQAMREERGMAMVRRANLLLESGRLADARAVLADSRGILETLYTTDPRNYALRRDLTRNYNLTANLLTRIGKTEAGLQMYTKALPLTTEILRLQPNQPDVQQHLADTYEGMGDTLARVGRTSEALENTRKALALREVLAKLDPNDARYQFSLAKNYVSFGNVLAKAHRRADAISNYRLAVGIEKSLAAGDPFNALVARDLGDTQRKLHALSTPEQANHH